MDAFIVCLSNLCSYYQNYLGRVKNPRSTFSLHAFHPYVRVFSPSWTWGKINASRKVCFVRGPFPNCSADETRIARSTCWADVSWSMRPNAGWGELKMFLAVFSNGVLFWRKWLLKKFLVAENPAKKPWLWKKKDFSC